MVQLYTISEFSIIYCTNVPTCGVGHPVKTTDAPALAQSVKSKKNRFGWSLEKKVLQFNKFYRLSSLKIMAVVWYHLAHFVKY